MTPSPERAHPLVCLLVWVVLAVATYWPVLAAGRWLLRMIRGDGE